MSAFKLARIGRQLVMLSAVQRGLCEGGLTTTPIGKPTTAHKLHFVEELALPSRYRMPLRSASSLSCSMFTPIT
jgi:hypothetical protein